MREIFEQELRENPEDPLGWRIFGDWLLEQGDPQGEFIHTQLELERRDLTIREREQLTIRERELLHEYIENWLGSLSEFLVERCDIEIDDDLAVSNFRNRDAARFEFHRGVLTHLKIKHLTPDFCAALACCPQANLLSTFSLDQLSALKKPRTFQEELFPPDQFPNLRRLLPANFLENLRSFSTPNQWNTNLQIPQSSPGEERPEPRASLFYGESATDDLHDLLEKMPRLQQLNLNLNSLNERLLLCLNFPNLEELILREPMFGVDTLFATLAMNSTLGKLRHLELRMSPGGMRVSDPDIGLRQFLESNVSQNLKELRLQRFGFNDPILNLIVDSGIISRLEVLELSGRGITGSSAEILMQAKGVQQLKILKLSGHAIPEPVVSRMLQQGIRLVY